MQTTGYMQEVKSPFINGHSGQSQAAIGGALIMDTVNSLDLALKELNECTELVRNLGNNLFGAQPEPSGIAGQSTPPTTASEQLRARAGWLHNAVVELRSQIHRLNAL